MSWQPLASRTQHWIQRMVSGHLFIYLYVYLFPFMSLFSKVNSLTAKKQLTAFLIPKGMLVLSFHLFI